LKRIGLPNSKHRPRHFVDLSRVITTVWQFISSKSLLAVLKPELDNGHWPVYFFSPVVFNNVSVINVRFPDRKLRGTGVIRGRRHVFKGGGGSENWKVGGGGNTVKTLKFEGGGGA